MYKNTEENGSGFDGLGIALKILDVLKKEGLEEPTPIQKKSIPVAIEGEDIIGVAQTGTGKTFAFGIPMLQRLAIYKGRGLVLLPTRELAMQVEESLHKVGKALGLRTARLIGGESFRLQLNALNRKPHILVATPGRIIDHINRKTVVLNDIKILVLDEADMMFDMGFAPQIREVISHVPKERQTMLFSATMPPEIVRLAASHMKLPVNIEVAPQGTTAELVDQEIYVMKKEDKLVYLDKVLKEYKGSVLVFTRTRHAVKALARSIKLMGHKAAEIHSDRTLPQRREALDGFKSGKYRILAATDIAARGIDVSGIELVLNYDLPENSSDYVHRIGRTARAGKSGKAISFASTTQAKEIRSIERLINKSLPLTKFAELAQAYPVQTRRFGYNRKFAMPKAKSAVPGRKPYAMPKISSYKSPAKKAGSSYLTGNISRFNTTDKQKFRASLRTGKRR